MAKRTIVALPGDGIGKIVLKEAIRVLDNVCFNAQYIYGDIGWDSGRKKAIPCPGEPLI